MHIHNRQSEHREPDLPSVNGWVEAIIFIAITVVILFITLSRYCNVPN